MGGRVKLESRKHASLNHEEEALTTLHWEEVLQSVGDVTNRWSGRVTLRGIPRRGNPG